MEFNEEKKINSSFMIRFVLIVCICMVFFFLLAEPYISLKLTCIRPILDLLYGAKSAPYVRPIPAYRGISIALVCFTSLVLSTFQKKDYKDFFRLHGKTFLFSFLGIIAFEIVGTIVEIMTQNFLSYYLASLMISVGGITLAIFLWFTFFMMRKRA